METNNSLSLIYLPTYSSVFCSCPARNRAETPERSEGHIRAAFPAVIYHLGCTLPAPYKPTTWHFIEKHITRQGRLQFVLMLCMSNSSSPLISVKIFREHLHLRAKKYIFLIYTSNLHLITTVSVNKMLSMLSQSLFFSICYKLVVVLLIQAAPTSIRILSRHQIFALDLRAGWQTGRITHRQTAPAQVGRG